MDRRSNMQSCYDNIMIKPNYRREALWAALCSLNANKKKPRISHHTERKISDIDELFGKIGGGHAEAEH